MRKFIHLIVLCYYCPKMCFLFSLFLFLPDITHLYKLPVSIWLYVGDSAPFVVHIARNFLHTVFNLYHWIILNSFMCSHFFFNFNRFLVLIFCSFKLPTTKTSAHAISFVTMRNSVSKTAIIWVDSICTLPNGKMIGEIFLLLSLWILGSLVSVCGCATNRI